MMYLFIVIWQTYTASPMRGLCIRGIHCALVHRSCNSVALRSILCIQPRYKKISGMYVAAVKGMKLLCSHLRLTDKPLCCL
jgi:hypothetical protein